jgi:hypothetical protein
MVFNWFIPPVDPTTMNTKLLIHVNDLDSIRYEINIIRRLLGRTMKLTILFSAVFKNA